MTDHSRNKKIEMFLPKGAVRKALAGDASFRRYERIILDAKTFVLMDAPPLSEDCQPFVAIAKYLRDIGLSAPEILQTDFAEGFLLLEDLGDATFNRALTHDPGLEEDLYRLAVDVLVTLHKNPPPQALLVETKEIYNLPVYDETRLLAELNLFTDWYLPAATGSKKPAWEKQLEAIWQPLLQDVFNDNSVLTLRDYHADNLMWLPERRGLQRVGLLDFQDAVLGHPAYDLVSLLQDARRPFNPALEQEMIGNYLFRNKGWNKEKFWAAYQILGAQRNTKIIGIFTRLWQRDGKKDYPKMIPHVWSLLEGNLQHPVLSHAKAWFDENCPKAMRRKIPR